MIVPQKFQTVKQILRSFSQEKKALERGLLLLAGSEVDILPDGWGPIDLLQTEVAFLDSERRQTDRPALDR